MAKCSNCDHGSTRCPKCRGTGRVAGSGILPGASVQCNNCSGSGRVKCGVCKGKGYV